jgi:tetratricopeptide (TPR) repeat protein
VKLGIALAVAGLSAGCAAQPEPVVPPAQERIAAAATRGAALARAVDNAGAAARFQEALRTARSIEDADAIAANAISLSIVYQRLGHHAASRSALALVLDADERRFPERRVLQAELRRAILEHAAREPRDAAAFARRAWERCQRLSCELAAAILNVQSSIALDAGGAGEALRLAQAAESAARGRADRSETANALRNVGRARGAAGDAAGAIGALEQALEIDRALADPRKILADLQELARASAAKGDTEAARGYSERALAISRAAREAPIGEETEVQLRLR